MAEEAENTAPHEESIFLAKTDSESTLIEFSAEASRSGSGSTQLVEGILEEFLQNVIENALPPSEETQKVQKSSSVADEILEVILQGVDYNIETKEAYGKKCQSHNQYGLFNLMDYIYSFNVDDEMFDALCFRECLIVSRLGSRCTQGEFVSVLEPVGGLCIDVQKAEGKQPQQRLLEEYEKKLLQLLDEEGICNHIDGSSGGPSRPPVASEDSLHKQNDYGYSKFLVHASSQLDVNGLNGGSAITTWVDRNLHTIEELRKEFIVDEASDLNVNEKALYIAMKHRCYYVKHTASACFLDDRKLYSMNKMRHYVSEGANFVLMRYLAKARYFGTLELSCCYLNGDMCRNIYECFGPESDAFHGNRVDCCRIKRTILEECGVEHTSITVLTLHGLIMKHEWRDCDYVLTMNPNFKIRDAKPDCLDEMAMDDAWTEDMQLLSKYLDMKSQAMLEVKTYDADHPELRQLLADYVNQILQLRPPDIKNFTYRYFGNFATTRLPRNDYLE